MQLETLPWLLLPTKGKFGLIDYEKVFCPDFKMGPDIFDHRGIDRDQGALIIVRPDQFVASVQPLAKVESIAPFFDRFMVSE